MSGAVAASASGTRRGRTRITSRALQRVVAAVTAEALGVETRHVDTSLEDHGGRLDLAVRAPITVPSIALAQADPGAVARVGGTILERCAAAEHTVRDRVRGITGSEIHRVTVRLTDVRVAERGRVR